MPHQVRTQSAYWHNCIVYIHNCVYDHAHSKYNTVCSVYVRLVALLNVCVHYTTHHAVRFSPTSSTHRRAQNHTVVFGFLLLSLRSEQKQTPLDPKWTPLHLATCNLMPRAGNLTCLGLLVYMKTYPGFSTALRMNT